ncbi:hypothetical protein [Brevundimonas sp.]|uniref:hypothetical protein n=1 Tax=Brevundimonas sp. TaxID=1871086 RepID=UPI0028AD8EF1|nr:hypothetical protein [Brevundimonas sp.]
MERIDDFSDERQKAWCIHCGATLTDANSNRDHAPTKSFLDRPFPHHVPQVPVCSACNNGFSLDEAYVASFLSCVISESTEPDRQRIASASRLLTKSPALRARIEQSRTVSADGILCWTPERERFERIVVKNARGHAFFELGEPMREDPVAVAAVPLETLTAPMRSHFEAADWHVWPEVGCRMMSRLATGVGLDKGWVVVQPGVYRYAVIQDGGIVVKSVIRDYLATETRWD